MGESLLPVGASYAEVYARFRWHIPTTFNIGMDVCDRHANNPSRLALLYEDDTGHVSPHTFAEFRARSNQLAHALIKLGIRRGDRVGIILSQRPETAVVHLAAYCVRRGPSPRSDQESSNRCGRSCPGRPEYDAECSGALQR